MDKAIITYIEDDPWEDDYDEELVEDVELNECWQNMRKTDSHNIIYLYKATIDSQFLEFLKSLDIPVEEHKNYYIFEDVTFAEANLIRYSFKYKDILQACLKLFGSYTIDNLFCAIVLSPYYWSSSSKNFGGYIGVNTFRFIQLDEFRKGFKRKDSTLFKMYTKLYTSQKSNFYEKCMKVAVLLKKKHYAGALKAMKYFKTDCNFQKDLKFVKEKYAKRVT